MTSLKADDEVVKVPSGASASAPAASSSSKAHAAAGTEQTNTHAAAAAPVKGGGNGGFATAAMTLVNANRAKHPAAHEARIQKRLIAAQKAKTRWMGKRKPLTQEQIDRLAAVKARDTDPNRISAIEDENKNCTFKPHIQSSSKNTQDKRPFMARVEAQVEAYKAAKSSEPRVDDDIYTFRPKVNTEANKQHIKDARPFMDRMQADAKERERKKHDNEKKHIYTFQPNTARARKDVADALRGKKGAKQKGNGRRGPGAGGGLGANEAEVLVASRNNRRVAGGLNFMQRLQKDTEEREVKKKHRFIKSQAIELAHCTFGPRLNITSRYGGSDGPSVRGFLGRMKEDLGRRERKEKYREKLFNLRPKTAHARSRTIDEGDRRRRSRRYSHRGSGGRGRRSSLREAEDELAEEFDERLEDGEDENDDLSASRSRNNRRRPQTAGTFRPRSAKHRGRIV